MLLCDDEPSPVSSDEVFFICEKETSTDRDDAKEENCENENISGSEKKSDSEEASNKKNSIDRSNNRNMRSKKSEDSIDEKNSAMCDERETVMSAKRMKEAASQTSQAILVKIQVENCSQCPDKSISLFSHEPTTTDKKDNSYKSKKKTVAVQVNFSSIETDGVKISKLRCCNKSALQNSIKTKSKSESGSSERMNENATPADSTKLYLWSGKNAKKKQGPLFKSNSVVEKATKAITNQRFTVHEPLQKSNSLVEKTSIKCKKTPIGCSPLKKLNRSSLTIEPDKITINLSKYSPCASRLAASSKILSGNSPVSPESPLQGVRSKSPRRRDFSQNGSHLDPARIGEKSTLQASLSLNIQQYQRCHPTPRSRSVGDSCVTSPTSEATTLSYSPTGTEILSLEEVGPQITVNDVSVDDSVLVLQKQEIRDKFKDDYIACSRTANLETKC